MRGVKFLHVSMPLMERLNLAESYIPGASLKGRQPNDLTVPELKRWLLSCGATLRGLKADLMKW